MLAVGCWVLGCERKPGGTLSGIQRTSPQVSEPNTGSKEVLATGYWVSGHGQECRDGSEPGIVEVKLKELRSTEIPKCLNPIANTSLPPPPLNMYRRADFDHLAGRDAKVFAGGAAVTG